jgi:hypothetical protein
VIKPVVAGGVPQGGSLAFLHFDSDVEIFAPECPKCPLRRIAIDAIEAIKFARGGCLPSLRDARPAPPPDDARPRHEMRR